MAIVSGLSGKLSRGKDIFGFCLGSGWDSFGHGQRQHLSCLLRSRHGLARPPGSGLFAAVSQKCGRLQKAKTNLLQTQNV